MKTLLIAVGLTATLFGQAAWAGQDAYQELRTRQVHEAKRAQAAEEAKLRACAEARRISARTRSDGTFSARLLITMTI